MQRTHFDSQHPQSGLPPSISPVPLLTESPVLTRHAFGARTYVQANTEIHKIIKIFLKRGLIPEECHLRLSSSLMYIHTHAYTHMHLSLNTHTIHITQVMALQEKVIWQRTCTPLLHISYFVHSMWADVALLFNRLHLVLTVSIWKLNHF